jgi:hypothetical protein
VRNSILPVWPALLIAPLLGLADLSIAYALVTPACATQQTAWLHLASASFLGLSLLFTAMAIVEERRRKSDSLPRSEANHGADSDADATRPLFTARVAVLVGLLSSLVIIGIWIPQWLLSPCAA